ncbi:MAG: FHA domain-containing protein [Verrucomicrobiae bacterium]|nr:FHA domain-containing protein [Verrucomicrobiae bacterium]
MKFRIIKGRRVGHEFEVRDAEVRLGRRSDNDLVLDDESASGHHAAFVPDRGGVLARDLGSVNGILVNGKTTSSVSLHAGDVVTIGVTEIEVLKDDESAGNCAPSSGDPSAETRKARGARRPLWKTALAALLVLATIAVAWRVIQKKGLPQDLSAPMSRETKGPSLAEGFFRLRYEKVQASPDNIFRYEMRIENDAISIAVDDLKQVRKLRRNKAIDPKQVSDIRDAIVDQQIFSLPPRIEGKSAGIYDSWRLSVVMRGEARSFEILNRIPPENFKRLCETLEKFGEAELGLVALSMSGDELRRRAGEAFQRAKKLYDERFVNAENLFNAIKAYTETLWYLDSIEPKPAIYADAIHGKQTAGEELDQQIEDHRFRAMRSIQLQEWRKARDELAAILQKLPDPADRRNQDARIRLLDVEKRLTPK